MQVIRTRRRGVGLVSAVVAGVLVVAGLAPSVGSAPRDRASDRPAAAGYGRLPLAFEANHGQFPARIAFGARGAGFAVGVTRRGALLFLAAESGEERAIVSVGHVGGAARSRLVGQDRLPGEVNYLVGQDPSRWLTHLPTFGRVVAPGVWPGVDAVFHGERGRLEYDFEIAPGADPDDIRLSFRGAKSIRLDGGDLVLRVAGGELRQPVPVAYQVRGGGRHEIDVRYRLEGRRVSFALGPYDRGLPLVIDPAIDYATYLGGSGWEVCSIDVDPMNGRCIAVDADGSAYVTGRSDSADFPTTPGAFEETAPEGSGDAFVAKLNPAGTALEYATYLGGADNGYEWGGAAIAVDATGHAYVTGETSSSDFPTTPGSLRPRS